MRFLRPIVALIALSAAACTRTPSPAAQDAVALANADARLAGMWKLMVISRSSSLCCVDGGKLCCRREVPRRGASGILVARARLRSGAT